MATLVKYNVFSEDLAKGVHVFGTHALKAALTNTAPDVSTHTGLANITEIAAGGGYTAGGFAITHSIARSGGTTTVSCTDHTFTATGSVATFRYVVLYNDTSTGDRLIAYYDYGSSLTLNTNEKFIIDFAAAGTIDIV